jgi:Na+-translocating ferredoxin:NAD+ oxidoreductase RnfE subunit
MKAALYTIYFLMDTKLNHSFPTESCLIHLFVFGKFSQTVRCHCYVIVLASIALADLTMLSTFSYALYSSLPVHIYPDF